MATNTSEPNEQSIQLGAVDFAHVLHAEKMLLDARATPTQNSQSGNDKNFSISFSGGGIRSAAFNLGVLQALAEKELLPKIDYLSTVSGGGYIGSWFMAWLQRDGDLLNVQKLLSTDRQKIATAELHQSGNIKSNPTVSLGEPAPIHHLRTHSNYLAPNIGVYSTDLWALTAIYFRNTLLNSVVLLPLIMASLLLLRYFRFLHMNELADGSIASFQFALGMGCLIAAGAMISMALKRCRDRTPNAKTSLFKEPVVDSFWLPVLLFALATGFISFWLRYQKTHTESFWFTRVLDPTLFYRNAIWVFVLGGLSHSLVFNFQSAIGFTKCILQIRRSIEQSIEPLFMHLRWIASGFFAGATLGLMLFTLAVYYPVIEKGGCSSSTVVETEKAPSSNIHALNLTDSSELQDDWWLSLLVALIIPCVLLSFALAESIQVGILGSLEQREIREKWSYLHAYCAVAAIGWFTAFLLGVVLPDWLIANRSYYKHTTLGLGSIGGTISGVSIWLAQSAWSGNNRKPILDGIVKLGPYVVLGILFVVLGILVKSLIILEESSHLVLFSGHRTLLMCLLCIVLSLIASRYVDVNIFSLQELYENRLVRAFLGASRKSYPLPKKASDFRSNSLRQHVDPVTFIDPDDDLPLSKVGFVEQLDNSIQTRKLLGPIHLINTAINLVGSEQMEYDERRADSFTLSPLFCGSPQTGYRETSQGYASNLTLGRAFATSGAAVSPNMGYYSTPAVTALLTFCNLRLGSWFPNPKFKKFTESGPKFGWVQIIKEIMGWTDAENHYIYLSDGGHFDNLGAYELIRRRCTNIVICDAGADPKCACHELALLIRNSRIDLGVKISIDISSLRRDIQTGFAKRQFAKGEILYPGTHDGDQPLRGSITYIKLNLTEEDPADLRSYQIRNPDFPHQSTLDQFYSESQFESYRNLGYFIVNKAFAEPITTTQSNVPAHLATTLN